MLYSQLGYYVAGIIVQSLLKEAAKEKILQNAPDASLVAIPLKGNETAIQWEEEGKELSLNGKLYDVVRAKIINGSKVYYCFDDKDEDQLLEKLHGHTQTSQQRTAKICNIPGVGLLFHPLMKDRPNETYFILLSLPDIYYKVALPQQAFSILVPPPRV